MKCGEEATIDIYNVQAMEILANELLPISEALPIYEQLLSTFPTAAGNALEKKTESEQSFGLLTNPARVLPSQEKHIRFLEGSRYITVKVAPSGFVLLRYLQPLEVEIIVLTDAPSNVNNINAQQSSASSAMAIDEEPQPPNPSNSQHTEMMFGKPFGSLFKVSHD